MTSESRPTLHRGIAVLVGIVLLLTGAGATYLLMRRGAARQEMPTIPARKAAPPGSTGAPGAAAAPSAPSAAPLPDVVVPLSPEAVERAGIVVAPITIASTAGEFRLPGVVEPNAYRQVAVTPLVGGRVTRVSAELGDRVRRGRAMAQIYSPELAEAQTRYVSARARLEAHDRELQRTQKLVEIGAASRQELERIHAEHAAQTAAVQSARSALELLGVPSSTLDALTSGSKVSATISVPAPIDGVVTERTVNVGLNVDPATKLFTVVDLSTVWVVADVYEKDFSRVRVGNQATVATSAYPGLSVRGRVSYIDPQVSPESRTAKVRVEIPNPGGDLRLGMYADVVLTGMAGAEVPAIPRGAVQNVGNRTVVYLSNPKEPGRFVEREVRLGQTSGERVEVVAGVQPGDLVVTDGSFFIRAERERLGLRPAGSGRSSDRSAASSTDRHTQGGVQTAKIVLNEQGFEPAKVTLRAGTPAQVTFVRTTDKTCGTEVVFPTLNIKRALPLNDPVAIEFTPEKTGGISFACGMNMLRGFVVVQ
jgi:membrane fusion protein, heavy metal efflux system